MSGDSTLPSLTASKITSNTDPVTRVIQALEEECGLTSKSIVADIGSGTGILSDLFLRNANRVFGVEPNREMRAAGERQLKSYPNFTSIEGTAESTTLASRSVDVITAGQSFHWFDRKRAREEFTRILQPNGWVVMIWNERITNSSPFLQSYEELLQKYGTDYTAVDHRNVDATAIAEFFSPQPFALRRFVNQQVLDFDGVKGRLLSSSYTPEPGDPKYQPMLDALRAIFEKNHTHGEVAFDYTTQMYFGRLTIDRTELAA